MRLLRRHFKLVACFWAREGANKDVLLRHMGAHLFAGAIFRRKRLEYFYNWSNIRRNTLLGHVIERHRLI